MAGLFSRAFGGGGGGGGVDADLKRVTDSGVIEVPKDLLTVVSQASHNVDDRREIMKHLRECLAEPSAKRWRRIYAALLLVEDLVKNGSQDLLVETAEGHHFDLVQRLSLLEHFECSTDRRVQGMVRAKATALRGDIVPRLQTANEHGEASRDCASTCSPGAAPSSCSTASTSVSNTSPKGGAGAPWRPEGQMVLNGIVAVGHTDDTTSESSGDEAPKAVQFREMRKSRKAATKSRRARRAHSNEGSTDDDDNPAPKDRGGSKEPSQKAAPAPPPPTVDLLGL